MKENANAGSGCTLYSVVAEEIGEIENNTKGTTMGKTTEKYLEENGSINVVVTKNYDKEKMTKRDAEEAFKKFIEQNPEGPKVKEAPEMGE